MSVDVAAVPARCRHRFPVFEQLVYLNSCSQGALSDSVRAAYEDYLDGWDERGGLWDYWIERTETAAATFARIVGAEAVGVAVTTSLSGGVDGAPGGADPHAPPRRVVNPLEFPPGGEDWDA